MHRGLKVYTDVTSAACVPTSVVVCRLQHIIEVSIV